jgi:hypothetical protein
VIVPVVETAEQAARIVAAAKYPPQGRRSSGGIRSVIDAKAVVPTNDAIFVAAMIGTRSASRMPPPSPPFPASTCCSSARSTSRCRWAPSRFRAEARGGDAIVLQAAHAAGRLRPVHAGRDHGGRPPAAGLPNGGAGL